MMNVGKARAHIILKQTTARRSVVRWLFVVRSFDGCLPKNQHDNDS